MSAAPSPRETPGQPDEFPGDPAKVRQLRSDALRNRKRVVAAAVEAFAAEGISVSMSSIARRAKVGVGTIYRQFPTKEDLFRAVVRQDFEALIAEAKERAKSDDPGPALFSFLESILEVAASKREIVEMLGSVVKEHDIERNWRRALSKLIAKSQDAGVVRPDVGVDDVMALIGGTCAAIIHHRTDRRARQRMAAVLCDGLRNPGDPRREARPVRSD